MTSESSPPPETPQIVPKVAKPRLASVDILRSVSIFGVVFIHAAWLLGCLSPGSENLEYMFRVAVPCFVVMWAFFYEKGYSKRTGEARKKYFWARLKRLLSVFLIWSCIYFLIEVDWSSLTFKSFFSKHFLGYGWSGQYFFIILLQLQVLFPWLRSLCFKRKLRGLIMLAVFCLYIIWGYGHEWLPNIAQKLGERPFIFWIPHVFLGIAISHVKANQHHTSHFQWLNKRFPWWLLCSILIIPLEFNTLNHNHYLTPAVLLASSLFVLPFLTQDIVLPSKLNAQFNWFGSNTMTLFVANPLLIKLWHQVLAPKGLETCSVLDFIWRPLLSTVIVVISGVLLAILINRTPLKGVVN
ncbi:MAG: acyltransferase [Cyanobacteria bacterium P01_D01_bin.73]